MSTLAVGTIKSVSSAAPVFQNTSGTEKGQLAKAWVNFNGTGTVAMRDNFNVSSVTDNGTGSYTVNIDTDMSNVNYCVVVASGYGSNTQIQTSQNSQLFGYTTRTAGSFQIRHGNTEGNSNSDADDVHAVVFGD